MISATARIVASKRSSMRSKRWSMWVRSCANLLSTYRKPAATSLGISPKCAAMRRDDIWLYLSPANRAKLNAMMADRNSPSKLVWRAEIVLATAMGSGRMRSCGRPVNRSRAYGAGRSVTWTKALQV
jgi:hypothetical protein